jgi:alkylation response protein AidB-like acyl-CoA dehydrogenase
MDFDFSEDQVMLRDLAREFLSEQSTVAHVREMMEDERGYNPAIYKAFVQLGMLPFPEGLGGGALGIVEQAIIFEEMGRTAYPGPYFATVILAGGAIMHSGDDNAKARYLPDAANGDLTMTLAFLEDAIGWTEDAIGMELKKDGDTYTLNGIKRFVPFGHTADVILVAARSVSGVSLIAVLKDTAGLTIEPNVMLDLNSKVSTLRFDNVNVPAENLIGSEGDAWPALDATLRDAAVCASAEMLGAARRSLEMSVDYAKVRKQFGQFIGQFQAVKHKLAEMLEQTENGHAAVYYAAWAIDADAPDSSMAASVAKANLNVAARKVCGDAVQVHGGIGFTWEYDLHLYYKRAKHLEVMYGDTDFHREKVLQEVLAGRVAGTSEPVAAS